MLTYINSFNVSYGQDINDKAMALTNFNQIYDTIRLDPQLERDICTLRGTTDPVVRQTILDYLPFYTFTIFKHDWLDNANFVCAHFLTFDVDRAHSGLRDKLKKDEEIFMICTTPDGKGLNFTVRLDEPIKDVNTFKSFYAAKAAEYARRFGVTVDGSASLTRLSHDLDLYVNPACDPVQVDPTKITLPGVDEGLPVPVIDLINKGYDEYNTTKRILDWNWEHQRFDNQYIVDTVKDVYTRFGH